MRSVLILVFVSIAFWGCKSGDEERSDKLYIVVTTGMIADAAENIAGDKATVVALMGPGVDPHLYKSTQGDLEELRKADVIFYNGLFLEGKMQEIFDRLSKEKDVFAVSSGIDKTLLKKVTQHGGGTIYDPHIWFDVLLWSNAVALIGQKLSDIDPENAGMYKENTNSYLEKLKDIHEEIKVKINTIPAANRKLITSHDAFGYFGRAYGIEVKGLQGISTAAEFGLKDVTDMVNTIIEDNIKAVFIESSVSEKSIQAVVEGCKQKGHDVKLGGTLYSDAMGAKNSPEGSYTGMIAFNVNTIVEALR